MNLYGAKFKEVVGIINSMSKNGEWHRQENIWIAEWGVAGSPLKIRQTFEKVDKPGMKMSFISMTGNGWLVSFKVNARRPLKLPQSEESEMFDMYMPDIFTKKQRELVRLYNDDQTSRLCLHTGCILSPEAFRTQMTLLRLFTSVWEL